MKRKLIAILLAVALSELFILEQAPLSVYAADGTAAFETVQNVGDELYGFKLVKSEYKETSESTQMLFEHVKTGAKMLVIKNSDLNRGFSIAFNTPPESDKGINHILEHSLLGGSEKYPSGNIIFNVMNNTYTSFVNAFTQQNSTVFPVCSQNEEQLMKLTDIYMDAVYHPLIAKDKKVFEREAWRYELEDSDSPLTVNGIVYNEMRGNYGSIDRVSAENDKKALFKDTNQQYDSGGVPSSILDLSYEEFIDTYNKNYIPSNSFMVLYGDVDYGKFLKMINDDYLSSYDKKEVSIDKKEQPAFDGLVEKDYDFPVSSDYDATDKSKIDIVFALPEMDKIPVEDYAGITMAAALLGDNSSDFMKALRNSNIAEDYEVSTSCDTYQPVITISAKNTDMSKKKDFYNLVMSEIKSEVSNGVNKELAKSIIASLKFSDCLEKEQQSYNHLLSASIMNIIFGDSMIDINSYYKDIESKLDGKYMEELMDKYIVSNKQAALVTTNPKPGLLEANNAELTKKLTDKKASMSADEISDLVTKTKEFKEWNNKETDQSIIDSLKAVNAKDIPVEVKDYNIKESEVQGIKEVTADADISGIGSAGFVFDESHLTEEELLYLQFYSTLIGNDLPTKTRTGDEIKNDITRKSYGLGTRITPLSDNKDGTKAHPVFQLEYIAMNDDYKDIMDITSDMLLNSNVNENYDDYMKNAISSEKQQYDYLCANPSFMASIRAMAYDNLYNRYQNYLIGIDYHNFILQLEKDYNENPQKVMDKIKEVRDKAFSKNNLTVLFGGNDEARSKFNNELGNFLGNLGDKTYEKASYNLPVPERREALTTNIDVQYMTVNSNLNNLNITGEGKFYVLSKLLNERFLIPELRLNGGAYGVNASVSGKDFNIYTFRDNDFSNSLNVINSTDEYMKSVMAELTDAALDSYIISTYAEENSPQGELTGAIDTLNNYMNNITVEDKKQILDEIKGTTLDSLKNCGDDLGKLNDNSNYVVVGSPEVINAHKDLFDKIIPLQ